MRPTLGAESARTSGPIPGRSKGPISHAQRRPSRDASRPSGSPVTSTRATRWRPDRNRASSPGSPVRVTGGVPSPTWNAAEAGRRVPGPAMPSLRSASRPVSLAAFQIAACWPRSSSRRLQPGCARRTSSWWMKNSTVLASSSISGLLTGLHQGGLRTSCRTRRTAAAALACRTCSACPASGGISTPIIASGRRSRTTRWAARSRVVQPSQSVGASGPTSSSRSASVPAFRARVVTHAAIVGRIEPRSPGGDCRGSAGV